MFPNNNPYYQPGMPQGPAFQRPAFQQQPMPQMPMYQQPQPVMMQDGMIQARFVSGREEAVASNVMPGSMFLFHDRANGKIYAKLIDPNTGLADFREYAEVQQAAQNTPQYVTMEVLDEILNQRLAALTTANSKPRKAGTGNDE